MRVAAYCAREFQGSTRQAAGVEPWTSPPYALPDVPPIGGCDLLYIALHGLPWLAEWLGDDGAPAIDAGTLAALDLEGAVVFAEACHLSDSPMLAACFAAGARAVVGGPGENVGGRRYLAGASMLGYLLRRQLEMGVPLRVAIGLARLGAAIHTPHAADDIAGFRVYRPEAA